ncbi:MAG: tripartite tricarboxylate transporter substrate binding protein [Casimicrobiaceae bacterium]
MFLAAMSWSAFAQNPGYPNKPVHLVVGFPPGGGADVVARAVAAKMSEQLGQPIVVENRAGASGNIGADAVVKSPADGYMVYLATASNAISAGAAANGSLKLNYELLKDFMPVLLLVRNQNVLVANPSVSVSNARDLIALARSKPGVLNFGSYGTGSSSHLAGELFRQMAGVNLTHIPYKGAAPLVTDLLGGQVELGFVDVAVVLPHIRSGKLKAIAIGSTRRFEGLPDVPTFEESGVPGYEASGWLGLMVPAGTPSEAVSRLRDAAVKSLAAPDLRERLTSLGVTPAPDTEFSAFLRAEIGKWRQVLRVGGIEPSG